MAVFKARPVSHPVRRCSHNRPPTGSSVLGMSKSWVGTTTESRRQIVSPPSLCIFRRKYGKNDSQIRRRCVKLNLLAATSIFFIRLIDGPKKIKINDILYIISGSAESKLGCKFIRNNMWPKLILSSPLSILTQKPPEFIL